MLYEGYLLYPYRASSAEEPGALAVRRARRRTGRPRPASARSRRCRPRCVLEARPGATARRARAVPAGAVARRRARDGRTAGGRSTSCCVGGTRWIPFHEAVAREVPCRADRRPSCGRSDARRRGRRRRGRRGAARGRPARSAGWSAPAGRCTARVDADRPAGTDPRLVGARPAGRQPRHVDAGRRAGWTARDVAARSSFVGTHLLLDRARRTGSSRCSTAPDWADADAAACTQRPAAGRCWSPTTTAPTPCWSSPIVLRRPPGRSRRRAPGDLFDATEIDEILTLRVMTHDRGGEGRGPRHRPAGGGDPRPLRRDADDAMARLHGARRGDAVQADADVRSATTCRGGTPAGRAAEPETDAVLVGGVPVAKGSRVLLRPSPPGRRAGHVPGRA